MLDPDPTSMNPDPQQCMHGYLVLLVDIFSLSISRTATTSPF
jgi:hypothetical protein